MSKVKLARISGIAMAAALTLSIGSAFAGCAYRNADSTGQQVDHTKTQLYVSNHDGGYGSEWLEAAADRFEELYANTRFEEGKMGVQIMIDTPKEIGSNLINTISGSRSEVFFTESVYYYDYVAAGVVADITDIVCGENSDLSEYGDTGTIEDKLTDQQISYYKTDGEYYGIPHYACYQGIIYDKDFFESDLLYFSDNGGFIESETERRSTGPDRKYCEECAANGYDYSDHDCDDGLPSTYDEFIELCDLISSTGNTPLIWSGANRANYLEKFMASLVTDYEGLEQMMLYYSFDGTAYNIVQSVNSDGTLTFEGGEEGVDITSANGYKMYSSAGKYYAYKFMENILSDSDYYHYLCFNGTHEHTDAQDDFLFSKDESSRIAMLIDGNYWDNEADDTFNEMSNGNVNDDDSRYSRKFGFMPLPKATEDEVGEKSTLLDFLYSLGFINANIEDDPVKLDLAKKFLKFVNTEESLQEFTRITGSPKSLNYTMEDEDLEQMSFYSRSVWHLKENSDVVYPYSTNRIYLNNQSTFINAGGFATRVNNVQYTDIASAIRNNKFTATQLFNGHVSRHSQSDWERDYEDYFTLS